MIELLVGQNLLKAAIRTYIRNFAYKTASTNDLIEILEKIDKNIDMRGFIESYVYQSRYPIITVQENETNNVYILKQISCDYKGNENAVDNPYGYKWTIPITYFTSLDKEPTLIWFYKDMDERIFSILVLSRIKYIILLVIIPTGNETWIKFNYKQIGFYRMNYSEVLWTKIIKNYQVPN